jgi:hypothetical protein
VVITLTLWSSIACVHVMVQTEHSSELVFVKTGRPARKKTRALCGQGVDPMRQSYSYNNMPHDWSSVLQDVDTGGPAKAPHQFLVTRSMEFTCPLSQQPPADGWCQPRDVADVLVVWVHNLSMEQYGHHSSTAIIITKQAWKSLYVFFVATCLNVLFDLGGHTAANDLSTQKFAEVYAIPYLLTRGGFFFFFSSSLK